MAVLWKRGENGWITGTKPEILPTPYEKVIITPQVPMPMPLVMLEMSLLVAQIGLKRSIKIRHLVKINALLFGQVKI